MDHYETRSNEQALLKSRSLAQSWWRRFWSRRDYAIGILLLFIVVVEWTSSGFITQDLYEEGYNKPFLLTYLSTATFTLYLLPYFIRKVTATIISGDWGNWESSESGKQGYVPLHTDSGVAEASRSYDPAAEAAPVNDDGAPLTTSEIAKLAAWFCLLWFAANWTLAVGLKYTSVASATILSSMSSFFTLAIGRIFRIETLTMVKIASVILSFGGVVLVSLSDSREITETAPPMNGSGVSEHNAFGPPPILGDSLVLLSSLFYAFYVTLLKVRVRSEARIDMQLFFGFVGLWNILFCWPIGVILHLSHIERFELPTSKRVIVGTLISMVITLTSDYLYVLAMLKTTPLVVTIGLSLTMPLAVIGDFFLHKPVSLQVMVGALILLLSFVAVGLEDSRNDEGEDLIVGKPLDEEGDNAVHSEADLVLESHHSTDSL